MGDLMHRKATLERRAANGYCDYYFVENVIAEASVLCV